MQYTKQERVDPLGLSETALDSCGEAPRLPWFALQVRSRYENIVAAGLGGKGYEWFLPTYWCRRRWSDRIKEIELPLFPGYLFCRFNPQDRLPILKTLGLISIVGIAKKPVPVDEVEIAAVRTLVSSGLPHQPWPYLRIGQRVRIEQGALCGLEGILHSFRGRHRIVISVNLLQRSVAAEIDSAWVAPIQPHPPFSLGKAAAPSLTTDRIDP
jgi:transcription antitermination factor NusG